MVKYKQLVLGSGLGSFTPNIETITKKVIGDTRCWQKYGK